MNNEDLLPGNEVSYGLIIVRTKKSTLSYSQGDGIKWQSGGECLKVLGILVKYCFIDTHLLQCLLPAKGFRWQSLSVLL